MDPLPNSHEPILSVAELNRLAREALEARLPLLWVTGEISNLTNAASGHVYFTLKDASAQVRCVMFRSRVQLLGWRPENGQRVEARALATLYEARGEFQLNVENLRRSGTGKLYEQFVRLKIRLDAEGLFDPSKRRPLPSFPRCIGIVSSPQAAALRDVLTTLRRRAPHVSVVLYPTSVQGPSAAGEIVAALGRASRRRDCAVLILCRGGGSIEDLWSFNDEGVARAIRASTIPVVTGIGHETDTTIADFAADLRAPTPTAAAEQAAPSRAELVRRLALLRDRLVRNADRRLGDEYQKLDFLGRRLRHPSERLARHGAELRHLAARWSVVRRQLLLPGTAMLENLCSRLLRARPNPMQRQGDLARLESRLKLATQTAMERRGREIKARADQLRQLNPSAVLDRGYSIATSEDGRILTDARFVEPGAKIVVNLAHGRIGARVDASDP